MTQDKKLKKELKHIMKDSKKHLKRLAKTTSNATGQTLKWEEKDER